MSLRMPRLFRRSQKYNVAKNCFLARIILLDNTTIEFNLLPDVTGADCLEKVAQVLDIKEVSYFGLQYQTKSESMRWVDKEKGLRKQLEKYGIHGARNAELRFGVQYYITNVTKLQYEITRYLYFLQLKHLILNGDLQCTPDLAAKLASYALQTEFGDHDEQKHTREFLSDFIFLPPSIGPPPLIQSLTEKASKLHQRHRGLSPASAELMYIKLAQQLPEYGHEAFQTLDIHGSTIWIGACFIGVFVKHSNGQPTIYFKWPDIFRMKVRDKNFGIETPGETVYFKMPDNHTAQYVLRMMINQHKFYRSELDSTPGLTWLSGVEGKKKSRSLHDLRSRATASHGDGTRAVTSLQVPANHAPIQRPLHKHMFRDSETVSPTTTREDTGDVLLLSITGEGAQLYAGTQQATTDSNGGTVAASVTTTTAGMVETHAADVVRSTAEARSRSLSPESTDLGPPAITIEEGDGSSNTPATNSINPSMALKVKTGNGHIENALSTSSGEQDLVPVADTSSQDSFELRGIRKKKLTGSLEHLDTRTPPQSLKIRTYSVEEQEEQEAASGTHDKRGEHLDKKLQTGKFYSEYELLPRKKLGADISAGQKPENVHKNRYRDVLPYEDTRVKLNPLNNTNSNDYINASYVNFTVGGKTTNYIVAQGPLEHTCTDFWQMVWEQNISILIMVTSEVEDGRRKCHRYFPADQHVEGAPDYAQFDQYRVSRLFVDKSSTVISRGFQLKHIPSGKEREITHLQYIDWPDHGIPEDPQPFLDFLVDIRSLRQRYDPSVPVLVHCSAGVGRSGVVVLVDMLMAMVDCGEVIDIPKFMKELRQQRMHLVQMVGQYKFVYTTVIQYIRRARLI